MRNSQVMAACLGLLALTGAQAAAAGISGYWASEDEEAIIEIRACGSAFCGRIVQLKDALDDTGAPAKDKENPDPALRARPVCGLEILSGLKAQGPVRFAAGTIYNPENGKTYAAKAELQGQDAGQDTLNVTGYLGVALLGETQIWTRAKPPKEPCPQGKR